MKKKHPIDTTEHNPSQLQQLRAGIKDQIEHLKEHIRDIQQESLKSMHEIINKTFQTLVADSLDNLNQQEKDVQQHLDQAMQSDLLISSEEKELAYALPGKAMAQLADDDDAGKKAIEMARTSAEQAMKHASEMVQAATKYLNELPPQA
jgi:hypothetical protein